MGKPQTVKQFIGGLGQFDDAINKIALKTWNRYTRDALSEAQKFAPVDKRTLQDSGSKVNAKITSNGVNSSFIFSVPYAQKLDDNKEGLTIKQVVNPLAQDHYTDKGVNKFAKEIMPSLKKLIGKVWTK